MIKIITFIVRIERTHVWLTIIYLTQGEPIFIVSKMLAFKRCMAAPPTSEAISLSSF
nr:hypothetical protein [Candidatus Brocadia sinica]